MEVLILQTLLTTFGSANHTLIPIHCRVVSDLSDFDGSWTVGYIIKAAAMMLTSTSLPLSDVGK